MGVVTAVIYTRVPSIVNCVQSSLHQQVVQCLHWTTASPLVTTASPLTIIVIDSLIVMCKSATSPLVMVQMYLDYDMIVVMTLPYDNVALVTL